MTIQFTPTSTVELRPFTREDFAGFTLCVDVLLKCLDDVGKPLLSLRGEKI